MANTCAHLAIRNDSLTPFSWTRNIVVSPGMLEKLQTLFDYALLSFIRRISVLYQTSVYDKINLDFLINTTYTDMHEPKFTLILMLQSQPLQMGIQKKKIT